MIRSSDWPSASCSVKPNMRSAAAFHSVILPPASETTTASPMTETNCCKSTVVFMAQSIGVDGSSISAAPAAFGRRSDRTDLLHVDDLLLAVAELLQHFLGVLAQQRRRRDLGLEIRELDRAADRQVSAAHLVRHFDDRAGLAHRFVIGQLLHAEHGRARNVELAQDVDRLELRLVGEPLFDLPED